MKKQPYRYAKVKNSNQRIVIYGEGILSDTVKLVGRKMLKGGKYLLKQYVFPYVMRLATEILSSGKKIFQETVRPNVERIISDKMKEAMSKILNKENNNNFNAKEFIDDTKIRLKNDVINPTIDKGKRKISETFIKIINGNGIKMKKDPK